MLQFRAARTQHNLCHCLNWLFSKNLRMDWDVDSWFSCDVMAYIVDDVNKYSL